MAAQNQNIQDHFAVNHNNDHQNNTGLWIFGYGSLCWQPGFEYTNSITGYIRGYSRKFWQGNTTHRGTVSKPGRVATLIEDDTSIVWGCAYEVHGEAALPYLTKRECDLGGYLTQFATFYPRQSPRKPFAALLYIATPTNDLWMGDAPLTDIAFQIIESKGTTGHNVEYIIRLASFMRDCIPEAHDDHLFTLEYLVRSRVKEQNINLEDLMGNTIVNYRQLLDNNENVVQNINAAAAPLPVDSFQFTSNVPDKPLRCLNM